MQAILVQLKQDYTSGVNTVKDKNVLLLEGDKYKAHL